MVQGLEEYSLDFRARQTLYTTVGTYFKDRRQRQ